jgi:ABC-type transporter Mla MlaB component
MNHRVIEMPSSVTVRSVAALRATFVEAFDTPGDVDLDCAAITEVDLSFVQLLESARRHCADAGRALRLTQPAQGAVAALLERAGFATDPDPASLDFWFHGAPAQ